MSLLIVGTLAFDSIETPYERRERVLGGSATYCALAARHFAPVRLVGVVGEDFGRDRLADLASRGIDTEGVEVARGKTFFWEGRYEADWNTRHTLKTELNVLEHFQPKVPRRFADSRYVFLANAAPAVQRAALAQCPQAEFVMADTMNLWINVAREELMELLQRIDGLVLNDEEARLLSGERNLIAAAKKVLSYGPRFCVLKKGEHGAFLIGRDVHYALPAYPVNQVIDPTGAGDSFAGGFMGYLASVQHSGSATLKRAMLYGTVTASYCVEGFSVDRLRDTSRRQVEERFNELCGLVSF
jgi:sugar/nucleoside kinase (ribokinase family)